MKNILDKRGLNFPYPTGIKSIDNDLTLNGIIKKETYVGLIAPGGVGKTSFVLQTCIIEPYLYAKKYNKKLKFLYFSYEMSKEVLIAKVIVYFLIKGGITTYSHNGKTHRITVPYILGDIPKDEKRDEAIPITENTLKAIQYITNKYIEPMFGVFDENWNQIEEGDITLYNDPDTAKGIYFTAINYSRKYGDVALKESITKNDDGKVIRKLSYIDHYNYKDKDLTIVMVIDHLRLLKLSKESRKQSMDKLSRDCIKLRDIFKFGIISIGHTNREKEDTNTFKFRGDTIYYEPSDQKDSGCYGEDCNTVISMFNPNSDSYQLSSYFGFLLSDFKNLIGVHFVKGRTMGEKHRLVEFDGAGGRFYTPVSLLK